MGGGAVKWGWSRINDHEYRFDARWSVRKDWASHQWYVELDGAALLDNYADPGPAMEAADKIRKGSK